MEPMWLPWIEESRSSVCFHAVAPDPFPRDVIEAVRDSRHDWKMCHLPDVNAVAPPDMLPYGLSNPLRHPGDCGDAECGSCRATHPEVRPRFLWFCLRFCREHWARFGSRPVYTSFGPGKLLLDWELLDSLQSEGCPVAAVHLVDSSYACASTSVQSTGCWPQSAILPLAQWLTPDTSFYTYGSIRAYLDCVGNKGDECGPHVLMQCDAYMPEASKECIANVLRPGGLWFQLPQKIQGVLMGTFMQRGTEGLEVIERRRLDVPPGH